jgi:hypothetical protein
MDRPIFVHIPKTGGSTMRQIILNNVDPKRTLTVGSEHEKVMREFAAKSQQERDQYVAALGHFRYGVHRFFSSGAARYFTFLRHPIERTLSAYSYALERPRQPHHIEISRGTFIDFASDPRLGQKQSMWLMGYVPSDMATLEVYGRELPLPENTVEILEKRLTEEFVLAGVLEHYDASLLLLQDIFNWKSVYYERANTTQKRLRYKDLNAEEKRVLDALTGPDFEIYDWVKARLEAQIEQRGDLFQQRLKAFQAANATYIDRRRQFNRIRRKLHPKRLAKAALRRLRGAAPPA